MAIRLECFPTLESSARDCHPPSAKTKIEPAAPTNRSYTVLLDIIFKNKPEAQQMCMEGKGERFGKFISKKY
jgi:cell division septation protein DedD